MAKKPKHSNNIPLEDGIEEFYRSQPDLPPPPFMLRKKEKLQQTPQHSQEEINIINGTTDTAEDIDKLYSGTSTPLETNTPPSISMDLMNNENPTPPKIKPKGVLIFGTVAILIIITISIFFIKTDNKTNSNSQINTTQQAPPITNNTTPQQPEEQIGYPINSQGNPGNQTTGANLIIAYNRAFYTNKDANIVLNLTDPANRQGKNIKTITEEIQKSVPTPLNWEARITPKVIGKTYDIEATIKQGNKQKTYKQTITVTNNNGKYYLVNIILNP